MRSISHRPSWVPRTARSKRPSMESKAASVRFKSLMSTMAPVMRVIPPVGIARHGGALADPAFAAALEQHPVFAAIGRLIRGGVAGRRAHARHIVRMHPFDQAVEIGEVGGPRDPQEILEVIGAEARIAGEVEVEGGEAGGGLGDVERFGGVAQLLFQELACGDIAQGADHAHRTARGAVQHLAAARQPAHLAARQQAAVFGLVGRAAVDGRAQFHHHGLEVLGVDGRHPLIAAENLIAAGHADEIEEQRGAGDVAS